MINFQPNCTIPPEPPAFVAGPNVRSTMNIVWSCISTILLCCWSIQHLNVPPQFQPKNKRQKLMRKLFFIWRKLKWMIITLFSPEFILAKAITDLRSCRLHSSDFQKLADEDDVPWSKAHTFLADMGGFALRFTTSSPSLEHQSPPAPSVDVGAGLRLSPQVKSTSTTREGQHAIDATDKEQDQISSQESGSSPPGQPRPRNPRSQNSLAIIQAHDSADITHKNEPHPDKQATSDQDSITQRVLVDESSPDVGLTKLQPTTKQHNRQAVTSEGPARQQLQPATPGNAAVHSCHPRPALVNERRIFRARVDNASQCFGDIMWRAFKHNEIISTEVYLGSSARSIPTGDVLSTLLMFEGDVWVLTAAQLIETRRRKLIVRLPHLTEDQVSDRNKGDLLVKLLALLQVSWMIIQIIARATLHLSSTPLEIMTLAFAACAFITFILLLDHPQDVTTSIYIDAACLPTMDDMRKIASISPDYYWSSSHWLPCIPDNAVHRYMKEASEFHGIILILSLGAGAAVFGGAHLVAWNFVFPTVVERTLWRTSSLVTMLGPLAALILGVFLSATVGIMSRLSRYKQFFWDFAFIGLIMPAILLARLFVIVEAFRSLYYLPQDAYFSTWAANAPYIA